MHSTRFPFRLDVLSRTSRLSIGLFGGSFNPPHDGHRHVSLEAKKRLGLKQMVWLVSPQNPLKDTAQTAPLAKRLAACQHLLASDGGHHASSIETRLGTRYTIATLRALKRRWPMARFVWVMGSDNLASFHRWQGWRQIAKLFPIAVLERPPLPLQTLRMRAAQTLYPHRLSASRAHALTQATVPSWVLLAIRRHPASSTEARKTIGGGSHLGL